MQIRTDELSLQNNAPVLKDKVTFGESINSNFELLT